MPASSAAVHTRVDALHSRLSAVASRLDGTAHAHAASPAVLTSSVHHRTLPRRAGGDVRPVSPAHSAVLQPPRAPSGRVAPGVLRARSVTGSHGIHDSVTGIHGLEDSDIVADSDIVTRSGSSPVPAQVRMVATAPFAAASRATYNRHNPRSVSQTRGADGASDGSYLLAAGAVDSSWHAAHVLHAPDAYTRTAGVEAPHPVRDPYRLEYQHSADSRGLSDSNGGFGAGIFESTIFESIFESVPSVDSSAPMPPFEFGVPTTRRPTGPGAQDREGARPNCVRTSMDAAYSACDDSIFDAPVQPPSLQSWGGGATQGAAASSRA